MLGDMAGFIESVFSEYNFCQVGIVDSFDAVKQRIKCSIAIKNLDGQKVSQLADVPVSIFRSGGYSITMPIVAGNECILLFTDRCLDSWQKDGGGVSEQDEYRMHDLSDAIAIVGLHHDGNPVTDYNNTDLEIRNEAGDTKVAVTAAGKIEMTSPVEVVVNSPLSTFNGDVVVDGTIDATGIIHSDVDVTTDENSLDTHTHTYVAGAIPGQTTSDAHTP
jgi:hypothetical protein